MSKQLSLTEKLFNLQQEIGAISKDANNPFYKSKYFDINKVIKVLRPLLGKHRLLLLQAPFVDFETGVEYQGTTIKCVDSGESTESAHLKITATDPQKKGAESTYYRRYLLCGLLGLEAEDDDGNAASGKTTQEDKRWLNPNTPEYSKAIEYLQGGGTLDNIKSKYKVSKKVQDELSKV